MHAGFWWENPLKKTLEDLVLDERVIEGGGSFPVCPRSAGPTLRQRCVVHSISKGVTVDEGKLTIDRCDNNL